MCINLLLYLLHTCCKLNSSSLVGCLSIASVRSLALSPPTAPTLVIVQSLNPEREREGGGAYTRELQVTFMKCGGYACA